MQKKYDIDSNRKLNEYQAIGSYGSNYGTIDDLYFQSRDEGKQTYKKNKKGKSDKIATGVLSLAILITSIGAIAATEADKVNSCKEDIEREGAFEFIEDNLVKIDDYNYYVNLEEGVNLPYNYQFNHLPGMGIATYLLNNYFNEGSIESSSLKETINRTMSNYLINIKYVVMEDGIYTSNGGEEFVKVKRNYNNQSGEVLVDNNKYYYIQVENGTCYIPEDYTLEDIVIAKPYSEMEGLDYTIEDGEAVYTLKK